jgi:vacuolar iron transporter family protein
MNKSKKRGIGFGITSGIITTLGLMIGLYEATNSKLAILGGIITIAFADAFSDSFGIHISEEAAGKNKKNVWQSAKSTFTAKFLTAIIFVIPIIFLELKMAIIINILAGFLILSIFTAKITKENKRKAILEHLLISSIVITITFFVGKSVNLLF